MQVKFKRSTALIVSLAVIVSALVGFAIGKVNSTTTSRLKNSASGPPVLAKLGFYPGFGSVPYLSRARELARPECRLRRAVRRRSLDRRVHVVGVG